MKQSFSETQIVTVLVPIIKDRAEDKGLIKSNEPVIPELYIKQFDELDIIEIIMCFEKQYKQQTNKELFVSQKALDVLSKTHSLSEFCYILHCCIENKPVLSEPSYVKKLKIKYELLKRKTKQFFNNIKQNIK